MHFSICNLHNQKNYVDDKKMYGKCNLQRIYDLNLDSFDFLFCTYRSGRNGIGYVQGRRNKGESGGVGSKGEERVGWRRD